MIGVIHEKLLLRTIIMNFYVLHTRMPFVPPLYKGMVMEAMYLYVNRLAALPKPHAKPSTIFSRP